MEPWEVPRDVTQQIESNAPANFYKGRTFVKATETSFASLRPVMVAKCGTKTCWRMPPTNSPACTASTLLATKTTPCLQMKRLMKTMKERTNFGVWEFCSRSNSNPHSCVAHRKRVSRQGEEEKSAPPPISPSSLKGGCTSNQQSSLRGGCTSIQQSNHPPTLLQTLLPQALLPFWFSP